MAGVLIGLKDLYFAPETTGVGAVFGTPFRIAKAIEATVTPNVSNTVLYADDGPAESASSEGETEIGLNVDALAAQIYSKLLGKQIVDGGVVDTTSDVAPYGALMFRALKSNGKYRYIVYYRGNFQVPEETYQTKGESVEYNTPTINGVFISSDKVVDANGNGVKRFFLDEDDEGVDPETIANWFTTVFVPEFTPLP